MKNFRFINLLIISIGLNSLITQVIITREFLNFFLGNELVLSIILCSWFVLTGLGALLGSAKRNIKNLRLLIVSSIIFAFLPFLSITILYLSHSAFILEGVQLNILQIILITLLTLAPYCLFSGFLFTLYSIYLSQEQNLINKVYWLDTIGMFLGGLLFYFVFIENYNSIEIFCISCFIVLATAILLSAFENFRILKYLLIILIFIDLLIFKLDFEKYLIENLYPSQKIVEKVDSKYGKIVITKSEEQFNFFQNGLLISTSDDVQTAEESIHYALSLHKSPRKIILIGGLLNNIIKEVLKYNPDEITVVENNSKIIDLAKKYYADIFKENIYEKKVKILNQEARIFLRETSKKFDAVIVSISEPSNAQNNRFYTEEFINLVQNSLEKDGIFSISLPSTENYISDEALKLNQVIYNTIKLHFKNIILVPSLKNYYIASNAPLEYNFIENLEKKNIENIYVSKYYLDEFSIIQRANKQLELIRQGSEINSDFRPLAYFNLIEYWLSYYNISLWYFPVILAVGIILLFVFFKPLQVNLFIIGFTGSSFEIMILFGLQAVLGFVYYAYGIIITIFMLGIFFGSIIVEKKDKLLNFKNYAILLLCLFLYSALFPFLVKGISSTFSSLQISFIYFVLLSLIISVFVGLGFGLSVKLQKINIEKIASFSYSADLIGAGIGVLLTGLLLVPLYGLFWASAFIAFLNLLATIYALLNRKKFL